MVNNSSTLINQPEKLTEILAQLPMEPGVYLMKDNNDRILYIGKSKKLRNRVRSYFRESQNLTQRIVTMVRQVVDIEIIVTDTETEALALEANLIKQHQPYFNILLKDDKKYPYVLITWSEEYPRIFITRNRRLGKGKDKYYGPYTDSNLLYNVLGVVKRSFSLRQRPQPLYKDRPCLNYDIGRCPGVCQKLVSPTEYQETIAKVAMIFQGRTDDLVAELKLKMAEAAEKLEFEKAAMIRDRLQSLKSLNSDQKVDFTDHHISRDAIALATNQEIACIQLFQIRSGKLIGRLSFITELNNLADDRDYGIILQRVLEEHYTLADAVEIPPEIIVQYKLPDGDILGQYLSDRKGKKVNIIQPQRQSKADLIEMVVKNANYELLRRQQSSLRDKIALEDLANILNLAQVPRRIEGYDIAHFQGSNAVGSQVVFIDGLPANQYYRHYQIKNPTVTIGHSDDFASHSELCQRRFRKYQGKKNLDDPDFPDLIMIDGGKGQLNAVVKVLKDYELLDSLTVVSLAKKEEEIFIPGESESLMTDREQPGVQLLRRLRDEAHRFAVDYHRKRRHNQMIRSHLDDIPGLGIYRQKKLLEYFHSIDYIRNASLLELSKAPGIGRKLAEEIYLYFHPN